MRTTIDIPDQLFRRAKKAAAEQGVALREIMLRALRAHLEQPAAARSYTFDWKVFPGSVRPDLPIDSNAALEELFNPIASHLPPPRPGK